ncbi:MAG: hypothetical protein WA081_12950 [Desulfosalsimonadaceae bacterium]
MTTKEIIKETFIDSVKNIHNFNFNAIATVETETEKAIHAVLDKTPWINDDARKAVDTWIDATRQGRLHVKGILDEQIKNFENLTAAL